ncbi:hypothetical protein H2278_03150 [Campylobacter sp. W0018]|uniref:hypothetical protein n=1 Tax=Campylobacter sp. W0018 TaxID=2735782 RepID=UPI00301DA358|nr:hypothetical protein [Campylobacter sp. W0018]
MKKLVMLVLVLFILGCGSGEPPIQIETFEQYNPLFHSKSKFLKITSLVDSVKITDIVPNRGKCKVRGILDQGKVKINKVLKYGQVWDYIPITGCGKLLEVQVKTDKGEWNFKF